MDIDDGRKKGLKVELLDLDTEHKDAKKLHLEMCREGIILMSIVRTVHPQQGAGVTEPTAIANPGALQLAMDWPCYSGRFISKRVMPSGLFVFSS